MDASKRFDMYVTWQGKLMLKLSQDVHLFPMEASRIIYMGGRLDGEVWSSLDKKVERVRLNQDNSAMWPWATEEAFVEELDKKYRTQDTVAQAQRELARLKQDGQFTIFASFISKFVTLADKAELDFPARVRALREKADKKIRDAIEV
jgi:hypothetical protein